MKLYVGHRFVPLKSDLMTCEPEQMGPNHAPMPHLHFFRLVQEQLRELELKPKSTVHAVSANGETYFGMSMLDATTRDFAPIFCWSASHSQRHGIKLYRGAGFIESECICLTDSLSLPVRQTFALAEKLPSVLHESLLSLHRKGKTHKSTFRQFRQTTITQAEAECAVVDMIRQGIVSAKRCEHIIALLDEPELQSAAARYTVWRLFNAAADSYKPVSATDAIPSLVDRSPRLVAYCKQMVLDRI